MKTTNMLQQLHIGIVFSRTGSWGKSCLLFYCDSFWVSWDPPLSSAPFVFSFSSLLITALPCLVLPYSFLLLLLLLLSFTTKENSNMSGRETDFNIESTKHLSKSMSKIIDVETHFESMLGPWAHLEPPWHLKGQGGHSKLPLLRILSQNGTP